MARRDLAAGTTAGWQNGKEEQVLATSPVRQFLEDILGETFVDFSMTGNRLRDFCDGILIPVVFSSVPHKHTAHARDFLDQIETFHAISNWACRLTHGISPLIKSSCRL
jgi:hypothetical protein